MALSEKKRISNDRYIAAHYTQVKISVPNEEAQVLEDHIKTYGYTKAGFIRQAIKDKIKADIAKAEE